jgi:hypothetical protein
VAEGGGLLNRYRVVKPYRGFESLRLRHLQCFPARFSAMARYSARCPPIAGRRPPFGDSTSHISASVSYSHRALPGAMMPGDDSSHTASVTRPAAIAPRARCSGRFRLAKGGGGCSSEQVLPQEDAGAVKAGLDGFPGDSQSIGDFADCPFLHVAHHHDGSVVRGQRLDRLGKV